MDHQLQNGGWKFTLFSNLDNQNERRTKMRKARNTTTPFFFPSFFSFLLPSFLLSPLFLSFSFSLLGHFPFFQKGNLPAPFFLFSTCSKKISTLSSSSPWGVIEEGGLLGLNGFRKCKGAEWVVISYSFALEHPSMFWLSFLPRISDWCKVNFSKK